MSDFVDTVDDEIDNVMDEGAEPEAVAAALLFALGQFLVDFMPAAEAVENIQWMLAQTAPVLAQLEQEKGTLH
ncbi:hypothetical protein [Mesorhizobium sp. WSM2239]|uniref:Uncharacterized protein n=2 Tax=unclassified Mesorhizobium TaxID=325217 RepID=A0AAU8DGB2_9HYPH